RVVSVEHPGRGHTDHDLIVVVEPLAPHDRRVVFCGDLIEESADPAIGPDSDVAAWPATVDRLLGSIGAEAIYVPGHGAVVDAGFVGRQRDWLANRPTTTSAGDHA
ncbi:MAG: MBL fold metallo-hydrolase, partial [Mycobacterium sp.]